MSDCQGCVTSECNNMLGRCKDMTFSSDVPETPLLCRNDTHITCDSNSTSQPEEYRPDMIHTISLGGDQVFTTTENSVRIPPELTGHVVNVNVTCDVREEGSMHTETVSSSITLNVTKCELLYFM